MNGDRVQNVGIIQGQFLDEIDDMLPQSPTMEIEYAFGFKEARFIGTTNWVYTEDYVLTVLNDDIESKLARSIKYLDDLVFYADDSTKIKQKRRE